MDCFKFKPCLGYEGLYEVSMYGDVRSTSRVFERKNGRKITVKGKPLAQKENKDGYLTVQLHDKNGVNNGCKFVHKLVWEAWKGKVPKGLEIGHWDGDCKNNCITNLYLCTHQANCNHVLTRIRQSNRMKGNTISSGLVSKRRRRVVCLDLDYNLVKTYDFITQSEEDGFSCGNVSKCCHNIYYGGGNITKGRRFMFEDDYIQKILGNKS